jgi:murein DD-endopeptidase MepM/ murein hydrolase activator NlpD
LALILYKSINLNTVRNIFALLFVSSIASCQTVNTGNVNSRESTHGIKVVLPENAPSIASDYGALRGVNQRSWRLRPHNGIDIVAPRGHPVLAPLDGVVLGAGFQDVPGRFIHLEHQNPNGTIIFTSYLHLSQFDVEFGDSVARGQKIGEIGKSGTTSGDVNHLHFKVNGGHVNPHNYWIGGEGVIECFDSGKSYTTKGNAVLTYPVACVE